MQHAADRCCLKCGYDLRALPAGKCPECGRAFDPADGRSFDRGVGGRRWWRRTLSITQAAVLLWLLMLPATFFALALTARSRLGHWPRPSLDDPMIIGLGVLYYLPFPFVITMPVAAPLSVLNLAAIGVLGPWRRLLIWTAATLMVWTVLIVLRQYDPGRVVEWWFD